MSSAMTSKIPLPSRASNNETKRAHFTENRVDRVHIERSNKKPDVPYEVIKAAARMDEQKQHGAPDSRFISKFHDEDCPACMPTPSVVDDITGGRMAPFPVEWHHIPWDEVEMKKHSLLNSRCHHFAITPLPDEVEMKQQGLIDSEGHHAERHLTTSEAKKARATAAMAHEKLEGEKRKHITVCDISNPHIKICRTIEIVDNPNSDVDPTSPVSSMTMLTGRPSAAEPNLSLLSESEASTPARARSPPRRRISISTPPPPKVDVQVNTKPSTPIAVVNMEPIVMTKTFDTESGTFEISFAFEVRMKPKQPPADGPKQSQNVGQ